MYSPKPYDLVEVSSAGSLKFFFVSHGKEAIAKVVEYSFYQTFRGKEVYNLGFGDYNALTDSFEDDSLSNNGDAYQVFNTVLYSVPLFFEQHPLSLLMVQGSDSQAAFLEHCLKNCLKNCRAGCKKFNQRIHIYTNYLNKYYDTFCQEYLFYGGIRADEGKILLEEFKRNKRYDAVMFERNFVNLGVVQEPLELFTMKKKVHQTALTDAEILAPIIEKHKNQVLFPRLIENAKNLLKNAEFVSE